VSTISTIIKITDSYISIFNCFRELHFLFFKMSSQLPPNLLRLFAPRPPLEYLEPIDKDFSQRKRIRYAPLSDYLPLCNGHDLDYQPTETAQQLKEKKVYCY
jgi:hypothetical protein